MEAEASVGFKMKAVSDGEKGGFYYEKDYTVYVIGSSCIRYGRLR